MLNELKITNFRCFESFTAQQLAPINLIVGRNNVGKTCLMDALELVATGNPTVFARGLHRRREVVSVETDMSDRRVVQQSPDVRCAFRNRSTAVGSRIDIRCVGDQDIENRSLRITRVDLAQGAQILQENPSADGVDEMQGSFGTYLQGLEWVYQVDAAENKYTIQLRGDGGVATGERPRDSLESLPTRSIHTDLNLQNQIADLWGPIAATDHEDQVLELLQIVEPRIERIAATPGLSGGIFVRLKGERARVPLGSFGDGTTRLFSLACNIISARKGLLLVDEIDTGLHYSTISKMWRFLSYAAKRLEVQVFTTTHSLDCLSGLASFLGSDDSMRGAIKLHRLERDALEWTTYNADEVVLARDADIEVR